MSMVDRATDAFIRAADQDPAAVDAEDMAAIRQCVRAMIATLREPTEAMVNAAIGSLSDDADRPAVILAADLWEAFITAALADPG